MVAYDFGRTVGHSTTEQGVQHHLACGLLWKASMDAVGRWMDDFCIIKRPGQRSEGKVGSALCGPNSTTAAGWSGIEVKIRGLEISDVFWSHYRSGMR